MKVAANIDLNRLRDGILSNQSDGNTRPTNPSQKVMVDREGKIFHGDKTGGRDGPLSEAPIETFAVMVADRKAVENFLPRDTKEFTTQEGVTGFVYSFVTELGTDFTLFLYHDGANYQVKVVHPEVEKRWKNPHTGHLYSDGRICFGSSYGSGMPTLRDAYAKSVLWANGFSIALETDHFPFSINNLNN